MEIKKSEDLFAVHHNAGFVEYPSLPNAINTGCINSPAYKSRFCDMHTPRLCKTTPKYISEREINNPDLSSAEQKPKSEEVVELLLDKICTRGVIYYKVSSGKLGMSIL